jgi:transglutaminase-like putative cysteine protease
VRHPAPRLARLLCLAVLVLPAAARAGEPTIHAWLTHLWREYRVNADLTYTETITVDADVVTEHGVAEEERSALTFYPNSQRLDVLEAWVDEPDGTRLPVPEAARFTRPSEAAQNAPGFTSAMTTTLLYPQVREGSRTHVVWRLTQAKPALLGFNAELDVPLDVPTDEARVRIVAPAELKLSWRARGGFAVSDRREGETRAIEARIAGIAAEEAERGLVDARDFVPLFLATSLPDLQAIGAIYFRQSREKSAATPEIAALAHRVAGDRHGLAAARAVYDWVAGNIRYVAVYLDPNDGWVPHAATEVLRNGYGDCKDHVALMQAMLSALGIRAEAALIEQGTRTQDLPLWLPQFNHVIVWLPEFRAFANPTNPYARFDSLDRLLADRTVVLATETGEVAKTPPQLPEDNKYRMESRVEIAADGTITGHATIVPSANLESAARAAITQQTSPRDVAERLLTASAEGGFGSFATSDPRDLSAPFEMRGSWQSPHGVTFDGREAFLSVPPGLDVGSPSRLRALLSDDGPRRHPLLTAAGDSAWTITLALPPGLVATRLPRDVRFENAAGLYTARYQRVGLDVSVARRMVVARGRFAASEYPDLEALIYAALADTRAVLGLAREDASLTEAR